MNNKVVTTSGNR